MVGQNIKVLISFILILIISCDKYKSNAKIDSIVIEYIDNELKGKTNKNSILYVNKDSSNINYDAYRIAFYLHLLDVTDIVPNKISEYNEVKIAYYTHKIEDQKWIN